MNPPNSKTIICFDVPPNLLHKAEAKKYFQTFGRIIKIVVKPKSRKCVVEYETTEAATEALNFGGEFEGIQFPIELKLKPTSVKKVKKDPDPDWDMDEEVKAELEAMGDGASFMFGPKKQYNLRPEKMAVDVELSALVKKAARAERSETKKRASDACSSGSNKKSASSYKKDLMNILQQQAQTIEDKFRILDARDKLIRLKRASIGEVHMLGVTVGTCPDMCPEKERLMREVQHQVALYEQASDRSMNYNIAVKQYSRSSADQETPLPHELRGVNVLQMTMGYLMHCIMPLADESDVNLAEWYHFLWDRMRGIRKDITQQELCCQGAVALVEQCARFHVHCSARLVAEDPSVFDQKINTENLTKCLQTLKYMYDDLAVKGECCANEAEFRAYVILLNLNDGNFMWEVQQLRASIQRSREVKFALDAHSALDANNFVRFFKLVRATTYLNACLLLRYFLQVRTKAMRTVARCYAPRASHAHFPVVHLASLLAFEDAPACVDFAEFCGLATTADGAAVVLSKRAFVEPDGTYSLERATVVIESKRCRRLLGEVVCGGLLPPPLFERHLLCDSFTPDGYLKNLAEFFEVEPAGKEFVASVVRLQDASNSSSREATDECKTIVDAAFNFTPLEQEHEEEEEEKAVHQRLQLEKEEEEERKLYEQQRQEEELLLERRRFEQMQAMQREREEQRRRLLEAHAKAEQQRLQRIVDEERARRKRREELEAEQRRLAAEEEEVETARRQREIQSAVQSVVSKLVESVEETLHVERLRELRESALARRVVQHWRSRMMANVRKRKAIDLGPQWTSRLTTDEVARELYTPQQTLTLNLIKRYKRGVAETSPDGEQQLHVHELNLEALTAHRLLANALHAKRPQNDIYWKVGVYYEDETEIFRGALRMAIGWGDAQVLLRRVKLNRNNVTYCLQKASMTAAEAWNGLIILMRKLSEPVIDKLLAYLNTLGDLECLPVYFVLEEEDEQLRLEVETLLQNKLISESETLLCDFIPKNLADALGWGLTFLSQQYRPHPPLLLTTLRAFLRENLGGEFLQKVRACAKWHLPYKRCVAKPKIAIALFNQAIEKLAAILLDHRRFEYPSFPKIFREQLPNEIPDYLPCDYKHFPTFWKSAEYNATLRSTLEAFRLPNYEGQWPLEVGQHLERNIRDYCHVVCQERSSEAHGLVLKVMATLLRATENGSQSWMHVVEVLLEHKLKSMDLALPDEYRAHTIFNQLVVVYQSVELQAYANDSWFYLRNPLVQDEIEPESEDDVDGESTAVNSDEFAAEESVDLEEHMKRAFAWDPLEDERLANAKKCKAALDDFRYLLEDLEESMKIQRVVNSKFQDNLRNYLDRT